MFFKVTSDKDFQVTSDQIRNSIGRSNYLALLSGRSRGAKDATPPFLSPIFLHFLTVFGKNYAKQECIPVGCVPAARWPYARVCFPGDAKKKSKQKSKKIQKKIPPPQKNWALGVWSRGGLVWGCLVPGDVLSRGCLVPEGVWSQGGVWSMGVCVVSQHELRQTPPPPCEQNDRQV